jgi:hypothetical protein
MKLSVDVLFDDGAIPYQKDRKRRIAFLPDVETTLLIPSQEIGLFIVIAFFFLLLDSSTFG